MELIEPGTPFPEARAYAQDILRALDQAAANQITNPELVAFDLWQAQDACASCELQIVRDLGAEIADDDEEVPF